MHGFRGFLFVLAVLPGTVFGGEIAITFDKLPFMEPLGFFSPREVSNLVLRSLKAQEIQAMGFVVEEKIEERPETYVVLQDWVENGHYLGIHNFSYADLNELRVDDFLRHVSDGQKYVRRAMRQTGRRERFFRYPMLHEGNTPEKKRDVARRLKRVGFVPIPATIVVSDFEFNHFFAEAFTNAQLLERLKAVYLEHLVHSLDYAEKQSEAVFGREIPQILRLHLGVASAHFLDDVLGLLEGRGYEFVRVEAALADEAYAAEETYVGDLGLGFIDRVALTRGLPVDSTVGEISRQTIDQRLASLE